MRIKSYIHVENLHVITPPNGSGIAFRGNSRGCVARNCYIEGNKSNNSRAGITFSATLEGNYGTSNKVIGNEIVNCFEGILGSGGLHNGGLVENNLIRDMRPGGEDGIVAKRGNYEGLIIRNNEITRWRDDGIDLFNGTNVIVEYNKVHDVASRLNGSGNCIKAGGSGSRSEGCIIRYNTVYNNVSGSGGGVRNGITSNSGDKMKIYGNLVYNVKGEAIAIPSGSQSIEIHHNTAISSSKEAIYVAGGNVVIKNNIFWGRSRPLNFNRSVKGSNNVFINGGNQSNYSGSNDIKASASAVFANPSREDYQLRSGSPAIDKGVRISGYTTTIRKRSIKGNPDIGVFEYGGASAAPPAANLSVSAGSDVTITLPTNSASFQAQANGNNGASVSYRWTKSSGPSATLNNTTSSKLELRNAQEGTYVLSVTASANGRTASDEVRLIVKPANDSNPPTPAPSPAPAPPTSSKNGLRYKYYEGAWMALPNFGSQSVRKQGIVSNFDLGVREKSDHFGMVFTGSIDIKSSGAYVFFTKSDDGSKLFIDGKQVVDNDGLHGPRENSGKITLSQGRHSIEVQFFERTGGEMLEVRYAGPGISKQRIPSSVLYLDGNPPPSNPAPKPEPKPEPKPNPSPSPSGVTVNAGSDKNVSVNSAISLSGSGKGPHPFRRYAWQKISGPSVQMNNQNTANLQLSNLQSGTYVFRFTATDSEGNSASDDVTLRVSGSNARLASGAKNKVAGEAPADHLTPDAALLAFPNPADRSLTVRLPNGLAQSGVLVMTDLLGRVVRQLDRSLTSDSQQLQLDTSDLPQGTYLLKWQGDQSEAIKIMISH